MGNVNKMPQGWIQTTLGDISLINPKLDLANFSDDLEISFIPMAAVETESGKVDLTQTRKLGSVKKGYTTFIDGDVIFAKITPCMENGKIAFLSGLKEGIGFGSTEFHVSRPLSDIPRKFIFYFLVQRSYRKDAQGNMTGSAGQLRVPTNFFRSSLILLPPFREQHRIVAKIEELFSELEKGVEALKTAQQQLKVYRQAILKWAFEGKLTEEWRKQQKNLPNTSQLLEQINAEREKQAKVSGKRLKPVVPLTEEELAELQRLPVGWCWLKNEEYLFEVKDGTHYTPKYVEGGIPFITQKNIREKGLDFSDIEYISEENHKKFYQRSDVTKGDIIISMIGHNRGMSAIVETDKVFSIKNVGLFKFFSNLQSNKFSFYYYQSRIGLNIILAKSKGGAQQFIGLTELRNWPVPVCAIEEQHRIVQEIETRLSVADKLEETITQSLQQAEALRQSILKKAFAGKLVPQDPHDEPAEKLLARIWAAKAAQNPENGTVKRRSARRKAASSLSAASGSPNIF